MTDAADLPVDGLVLRDHAVDGTESRAWFSQCGAYRYGLRRLWDGQSPPLLFIMLNPSTADERHNDPTVARCETRARRMGFGGLLVANLFAYRATRPADLKAAEAPVGAFNDHFLRAWSRSAGMTIAAWGVHGAHQGRAQDVAATLPDSVYHLGVTKAGHPRHPLYVAFDTAPALWPLAHRYAQH